ncbi:hypothetical protein CDD82_6050 [Ophiocordyceps australis]|uniref:Zn(2)-C6 fungal-type domain-containing protein n=1 Tax=Ophiocordyceps australis TaxID=1399860 RepID=A0A2C5YWZ1_9HYPO|nr:hypothetical protein CDD82_6050 [Ophiocordyceps australis]
MSEADSFSSQFCDDEDARRRFQQSVALSHSAAHGRCANVDHVGMVGESAAIHVPRPLHKGRRRTAASGTGAGSDQVKHRRTRSGCFMCRSRRVKCDETRPICDHPAPSKASSSQQKSNRVSEAAPHASSRSSSDDDDDEEQEQPQEQEQQQHRLETIADQDKDGDSIVFSRANSAYTGSREAGSSRLPVLSAPRLTAKRSSESLSREGTRSNSSPAASTAGSISTVAQTHELALALEERANWSHLSLDLQHYLEYFVHNITNHHYSLGNDGDGFFSSILPTMAVKCEPLLYAVVGFAAYHCTIRNPDGQLPTFLRYYNKSVTLLLGTLQRKETQNVLTLVTILQLAAIEEYLGDWVNLMGHQKAAFEIITKIFAPDTIMETAVGRTCLNWYSRYDNYVAIMGGFPTELPREWFNRMAEYNAAQVAAHPDDMRWRIDDRCSRLRVISYDMSMLYARGSRGQISAGDFNREHKRVKNKLLDWKKTWHPALTDAKYLVTDHGCRQPPDPNDIVNPYEPGILFRPPLFTTTLITAEWHSIFIMHLTQSANTSPQQLYAELCQHAYIACQYFESVEFWPLKPKGSLIPLQPCISIAALFLPKDERHNMWIRRKFALLDELGYIHPTTRRIKMAELFGDRSCAHWWLPNGEGLTPVLQSVRAFADERNAAAVNAQQENLREVRHLFAKLELDYKTERGEAQ